MIIILLTLSFISVLTEACETPRCTIQNTNSGLCHVDKKSIDKEKIQPYIYNGKISVKFYNVTTEPKHTNSNENIQINIRKVTNGMPGTKQNLQFITMEVTKNNLPWRYIVNIQKKETVRKDKELMVILSCLQMSTPASKSNITIALGIEPLKKQKRKKKNQYTKKNSKDVSEIGAISFQHSMTRKKKNEPKGNKMKRSAQGSEKNCIVNITSKTITFWWSPNKGNKRVYRCGLMDSNGDIITGTMSKTGMPVYCVTPFIKDEHYYARIFFYVGGKRYHASPCNVSVDMRTMETYKPNDGDPAPAPVDSTLVAVLVILFTAMCILFVFIICLFWSRRKLQHINEVDDMSSDPKAMIVSVNEFENGIPQLVSLLEGAKINVVTVASNVKENMLSRHDWLEKTVGECNHFIFIVTKQMGEILKRMITDHPKQREADSSIDSEGETCAYTIALIKNKFIKSLKYEGFCVNSCHLVSFDENYCDGILRSHQGRELFPCIKTHSYNLYLKERFQFSHACRIINNIKRSEKSKARKVRQPTPSQICKRPKESMDIESAFVSMIPSTYCNFIPVSQTESNENDSDIDIDVTSDLLGYEMYC
ncbi:uncharacterized protein LOC128159341 [Crassostrea angulata]|uniref:uncharacterized protein LOC128159341 n=1 Tax=Magallana angulata TaxID=2784310 RepID=UPI0022B169E5|nr:uncharacterized protein LOC128159341 [Crassostrea angulata]